MNDLSVYTNKTLGGQHCWYCGAWLFDGINTKDHFWPHSKGGRLKVRCCKNCNGMKENKTPLSFIAYINKLREDNPAKQIYFATFDRMINATQTLWDRVKWSIENPTIYEQKERTLKSANTSGNDRNSHDRQASSGLRQEVIQEPQNRTQSLLSWYGIRKENLLRAISGSWIS